jgi:hypothetical protein
VRPREFASKWRPNSTVPAGARLARGAAGCNYGAAHRPDVKWTSAAEGRIVVEKVPKQREKCTARTRKNFLSGHVPLRVFCLQNEKGARFVLEKWDESERGFWAHLWLYGAKLFKYRSPLATNIFLRLILFTQITRIPETAAEIFL